MTKETIYMCYGPDYGELLPFEVSQRFKIKYHVTSSKA